MDPVHTIEGGVTVLDPQTFVVHWKTPFLYANAAPPNTLLAVPRHLMWDLYQQGDKQPFINSPYWTSEFVSSGPYKVTRWVAGSFITLCCGRTRRCRCG